MHEERYADARRFADEALVDAELARAKAEAATMVAMRMAGATDRYSVRIPRNGSYRIETDEDFAEPLVAFFRRRNRAA